jgi:hypothetical protein
MTARTGPGSQKRWTCKKDGVSQGETFVAEGVGHVED